MTSFSLWFELNRHRFDQHLLNKLALMKDNRDFALASTRLIREVRADLMAEDMEHEKEWTAEQERVDAEYRRQLTERAPAIVRALFARYGGDAEKVKQELRNEWGPVVRELGVGDVMNQAYKNYDRES